jgi:hypothetical protein
LEAPAPTSPTDAAPAATALTRARNTRRFNVGDAAGSCSAGGLVVVTAAVVSGGFRLIQPRSASRTGYLLFGSSLVLSDTYGYAYW